MIIISDFHILFWSNHSAISCVESNSATQRGFSYRMESFRLHTDKSKKVNTVYESSVHFCCSNLSEGKSLISRVLYCHCNQCRVRVWRSDHFEYFNIVIVEWPWRHHGTDLNRVRGACYCGAYPSWRTAPAYCRVASSSSQHRWSWLNCRNGVELLEASWTDNSVQFVFEPRVRIDVENSDASFDWQQKSPVS